MVSARTRTLGYWPQMRGLPAILLTQALVAMALLCLWGAPAWGQASTLYLLTVKKGLLDPSGSGDTYLEHVETVEGHGSPNDDRVAQPLSFELDIYGVTASSYGLGVGVETLGYTKTFFFNDGEIVSMRVKGVHYTIKTFLRFGGFLPFIGLGIGNYYVNLSQTSGLSIRESPDDVYNARVGFRWMFGRTGILMEWGSTSAEIKVRGLSGDTTLELGGEYTNFGLTVMF